MRITVLSETDPVETRAAITPEMVKKYKNLGADVVVQAGAGSKANISDAELEAAGAAIAQSAEDALRGADIVLKVRRPADGELNGLKDGALVIRIPGEGLGLDSWAAVKRVGWCAMSRGGRPWRELLVI